MYNHKIVNADTGEETIVPMTADEIKIIEANIAQSKIDEKELNDILEKKSKAMANLEALGLTVSDLEALGF